jgi:ribonuclease VapC
MVIDTSAIAAIVLGEPDRDVFTDAITRASTRKISAASVVELVELYVRRLTVADPVGAALADLADLNITIVGINNEQTFTAMAARVRYGKGRHPAGLNFGDCFAYALAKAMDEPLLFKGDDFAHTDVVRVV